jgi:hypothetical protein
MSDATYFGTAAIAVLVAIAAAFSRRRYRRPQSTAVSAPGRSRSARPGARAHRRRAAWIAARDVGTIVLNRQIARKVRRRVIALANAAGLASSFRGPLGTSAANVSKALKGCSSAETAAPHLLRRRALRGPGARTRIPAGVGPRRRPPRLAHSRYRHRLKRLRSPICCLRPARVQGSTAPTGSVPCRSSRAAKVVWLGPGCEDPAPRRSGRSSRPSRRKRRPRPTRLLPRCPATSTARPQPTRSRALVAASDASGQVSYGIYRDGTIVTSTTDTSYTFSSIACGRRSPSRSTRPMPPGTAPAGRMTTQTPRAAVAVVAAAAAVAAVAAGRRREPGPGSSASRPAPPTPPPPRLLRRRRPRRPRRPRHPSTPPPPVPPREPPTSTSPPQGATRPAHRATPRSRASRSTAPSRSRRAVTSSKWRQGLTRTSRSRSRRRRLR